MTFRSIFYINGILLLIFSVAMLLPLSVDLHDGNAEWKSFAVAQLVTGLTGLMLIFTNRQDGFRLSLRETFLLTAFSWLAAAAFGALPFVFSGLDLTYTQSFFEAMSGITATGSTVLRGLDDMPRGILLWRSMLHWLGGAGFLVTAMSILPMLQVSGMQMFRSQSLDVEKIMPSASQMAIYVSLIYAGLTALCAFCLSYVGMSGFDAICHAMGALSTGGFSTHDASVGFFHNGLVSLTLSIFMVAAALPFVLYVRVFKKDEKALLADSQVRTFFGLIGLLSMIMACYLFIIEGQSFTDAVRHAVFLTVSTLTTTGFASGDYTLWGPFVAGIVFLAMFVGGCSGSPAGGIKVFRLKILWFMVQQQLRKLVTPHGVFQVHYNGKIVEPNVQAAVAGLFFIAILAWVVVGVLLQLTGLAFAPAFFSAVAAISNTGTGGFLSLDAAYAGLESPSLWVLSVAMLFGRLEFLTLLVVLMPRFWR